MAAIGGISYLTRRWFDPDHFVLDLGAPGPYRITNEWNAPNQAPAIRAAMDWINENYPNRSVFLKFPPGQFHVAGLIRNSADNLISWQGDAAGTSFFVDYPDGQPTVWDGFGRSILDGTYWRDASAVLDGSSGQRYGLALPQGGVAGFMTGDSFDWPWDGRASRTALTVSVCFQIEDFATYHPSSLTLCSLGDIWSAEGVFVLGLTPVYNQANVFIHSADGSARYDFPLDWSDDAAVHRIDFQWDSSGTLTPWSDNVQKTATPVAWWGSSPRTAMGALKRNDRFPFLLNSAGNKFRLGSNYASYAPAPVTYYGLHVSRTKRFAIGTAGSTLALAGGGTPTDLQRYFTPDAQTAGLLPLTDPPPTAPAKADPFWRAYTGAGESVWGVVCPPPVFTRADWFTPTFDPCSYAGTKGIGFRAYRTAYMAGQLMDRTYEGCGFASAAGSGFGQYEVYASYMVQFDGCSFAGNRDDLQLASSLAIVSDCVWRSGHSVWCNVRTIGSELELRSPKIYSAVSGEYAIELWGGDYSPPITTITHAMIDNEVYQGPTLAIIATAPGGRLVIQDSDLGGGAADCVGVELRDMPEQAGSKPNPGISFFQSERCKIWHGSAFVKVTGPSWYGEIRQYFVVPGPEAGVILLRGGTDDCGGVVVRDDTAMAPRQGGWIAGRAEQTWAAAGPGMVRRWVCAQSGDDHAADPANRPAWGVAEVMPAAHGELSGYGWSAFSGIFEG